jgi:hypothetical protein
MKPELNNPPTEVMDSEAEQISGRSSNARTPGGGTDGEAQTTAGFEPPHPWLMGTYFLIHS